ncbi:MAG: P27 family phage terminase small subunit [Gammaproteobacteria bacterium]|nr:P27 family phage terminase small subunit [Gammaproteobacteria bacterium]
MTAVDRSVFTTFILSATAIDECAATLNREGLLVETPRGLIEHPACRTMARLSAVLLRAAAECGFSPASRPRIQVQPQDAPNPFTAFRAAASKPH